MQRVIDLSEEPVALRVRAGLLQLRREEGDPLQLPLAEIAVLLLAHPRVTCTLATLSGVVESGGAVVVCDEKRLPVGMMLPVVGHHAQVPRFRLQADAGLPLCKRLWQQVVQAKIEAQSAVLESRDIDARPIAGLAAKVRSGDPQNVEAWAARRYWQLLFAGGGFRRDTDGPGINAALNYGYAVVRALTGRAICAAGLHPSLGIHHHNRYDAYALADDLMEPFRPRVDHAVAAWADDHGADFDLDRDCRAYLLERVTARMTLDGESRTLFDCLARLASSLADAFAGDARKLTLPVPESLLEKGRL